MLRQWCRTFFYLSLRNENKGAHVFFQLPFTLYLSDTSINTNTIYANLNNVDPLKKRISRSITSANRKQNKTV